MVKRVGRYALRAFETVRRKGYVVDAWRRRASSQMAQQVLSARYGRHIEYRSVEAFAAEAGERWAIRNDDRLRLSIVIVTYQQPTQLECLLASLACQTLMNFEVLVYHDGPSSPTREVVDRFSERLPRISYHESEVRHNDWGHSLRQEGLATASGDYVLITNGDNYYVPRFVEFAFDAADRDDFDMILWNLVHSYSSPGQKTLRCYTPFHVHPFLYMVDTAAAMVKTPIAQQVGFAERSHDADAKYIEAILSLPRASLRIGKLEKTLAVHN